jgi:hypothetical protein
LKKAKVANEIAIKKEARKMNPTGADFIVDHRSVAKDSAAVSALDNAIKDHSVCSKCSYAHDKESACMAADGRKIKTKPKTNPKTKCKKCNKVHDGRGCMASDAADLINLKGKSISANSVTGAYGSFVADELNKIAKSLNKKGATKAAKVVASAAADFLPRKTAVNSEAKKSANFKSDFGYLVDKKANYVIHELGKIASDLRRNGNGFAADMVETTASDITKEALQKAATKLEVIEGLTKMAKESYAEGDGITGDVIQATILNIKKG